VGLFAFNISISISRSLFRAGRNTLSVVAGCLYPQCLFPRSSLLTFIFLRLYPFLALLSRFNKEDFGRFSTVSPDTIPSRCVRLLLESPKLGDLVSDRGFHGLHLYFFFFPQRVPNSSPLLLLSNQDFRGALRQFCLSPF